MEITVIILIIALVIFAVARVARALAYWLP